MADIKCDRCDVQLNVGKVCADPMDCVKNLQATVVKLNRSVSFWKDGWYEQRTATANNFVHGFNEAKAQCKSSLLKVLSLFGQMNRERNEDGTQVMKMQASDRRELIDEGFKIVKSNRWSKPSFELDIYRLNALLELDKVKSKKPIADLKERVFPTQISIVSSDNREPYYLATREECELLIASLKTVQEQMIKEWRKQ